MTRTDQLSNFGLTPSWAAYFQMTKPTISLLVVFTAIPSLFMASGADLDWMLVFNTLLGTFLASASASMLNHIIDSKIDADMERTRGRPLPMGKVSIPIAVTIALFLGSLSFALMFIWINPLTAWLGVFANVFYVLIYTYYLKPRTVQNIVIGGAAGSVGPLIGWAAVTGTLSWEAWVLFGIVFLWTPPHFWALAIKYRDDYAKAKIPMLPSVRGLASTYKQIILYTFLLIPLSLPLYIWSDAGLFYLVISFASSCYFAYLAIKLRVGKTDAHAMKVFYFSLLYIFLVFGSLAIEQLFTYLMLALNH